MKTTSLSQGKKNVPEKNSDAAMKNNSNVKRNEELSKSGLEFHKPFALRYTIVDEHGVNILHV